jgi:hypothetical protein
MKQALILVLIPSMVFASPAANPTKSAQSAANLLNSSKTIEKLFESQKSKLSKDEQALLREYFVIHKIPLTQIIPKATAKDGVVKFTGSDLEIVFEKDGTLQYQDKVLNLFNPDFREFLKVDNRDQKVGRLDWLFSFVIPQAEAVPVPLILAVLIGVPIAALVGVGAIDWKMAHELKEVRCGADDRFFYIHPKSYPGNDTPIDKAIKPIAPGSIAQILGAHNYPKCTRDTAADLEAYLKCDPSPEIRKAAQNYSSHGMDCTPAHKVRYDQLMDARKKSATTSSGTLDGVR